MFGGLFWAFVAALIVSGALAAVELIKKKNPQAGEAVEKIAQFQGYIGLGLLVTSVIELLRTFRILSFLFSAVPLSTIILLAAFVSGALLGVFQAIDLGKQWGILSEEKGNELAGKLSGIKIPLGIVAVSSGLYLILWNIVRWKL